jgi:hypothetical protein
VQLPRIKLIEQLRQMTTIQNVLQHGVFHLSAMTLAIGRIRSAVGYRARVKERFMRMSRYRQSREQHATGAIGEVGIFPLSATSDAPRTAQQDAGRS